jgi:protein TonB
MIRHWAGTAQPEQSSPESPLASPVLSSPLAKLSAVPLPTPPPVNVVPHRLERSDSVKNLPLRRLRGVALAALLAVAVVSAWQWHRGWQQLEAQTTRKDAHARPPSARVPPEVMERLLIHKVDPVYPEAARRSNVRGVVVLDAIIAADGTVVHLHPLSGPEGLTSAAMDAVRWWRFRPYRVQGEAAPVETSLAIEFRP